MPILKGDTIELHYWFNDDSHTMNAIVFNKCEYEFLGIVKEIAQKLKIELDVETEPLQEGGLRTVLGRKHCTGRANDRCRNVKQKRTDGKPCAGN